MLTWELELRAPLADLFRALRAAAPPVGASRPLPARRRRRPSRGEPLAALLRGSGAQPRSGALAGRLLRVLSELGLIALAAEPLAVTVPAPAGRTELERSAAFRAYAARLADGLAHLDAPDREHAPAAAPAEPAVAVA